MEQVEIGVIGMGSIGKMLTTKFSLAGYKVNVCDLPSNFEKLKEEYSVNENVNVFKDGKGVSRRSDLILYCVEAENIERVVAEYGPSTKMGSIVGGQTSVKFPEIQAFEKHLPDDVSIVTIHSMHGPGVDPRGQPVVVIGHRCIKKGNVELKGKNTQEVELVAGLLEKVLQGDVVHLNGIEEHDQITADTQAVTHLAFVSMGAAWKSALFYPWENSTYVGGIDNVKVLITLRIFNAMPHIYAGLAMLNPHATKQIWQYSQSVSAIFKLMIQEKDQEFKQRITQAGHFVFGNRSNKEILLPDELLEEFGLGAIPAKDRKPNSHLSLLAMVDCWYQLKINPYDHMICQTPPFRLWLGIAEYLFKSEELLKETLETALYDKDIRSDDMEFYASVREWATIIINKDSAGYVLKFSEIQKFFGNRTGDAAKASNELIKKLTSYWLKKSHPN